MADDALPTATIRSQCTFNCQRYCSSVNHFQLGGENVSKDKRLNIRQSSVNASVHWMHWGLRGRGAQQGAPDVYISTLHLHSSNHLRRRRVIHMEVLHLPKGLFSHHPQYYNTASCSFLGGGGGGVNNLGRSHFAICFLIFPFLP